MKIVVDVAGNQRPRPAIIHELRDMGATQKEIAKAFGISVDTLMKIKKKKSEE